MGHIVWSDDRVVSVKWVTLSGAADRLVSVKWVTLSPVTD